MSQTHAVLGMRVKLCASNHEPVLHPPQADLQRDELRGGGQARCGDASSHEPALHRDKLGGDERSGGALFPCGSGECELESGTGNWARRSLPCPSVCSVVGFSSPKTANARVHYQVSWVSTLALFTNRKQNKDLAKMAKFQT